MCCQINPTHYFGMVNKIQKNEHLLSVMKSSSKVCLLKNMWPMCILNCYSDFCYRLPFPQDDFYMQKGDSMQQLWHMTRREKVVLSTKHANQNKYPISYSIDQYDTQIQLWSKQSVSIFHVLSFHRRSYITSKLVSNCCPMVIDAKRKHTTNTWFKYLTVQFLAFLLWEESSNICSGHFYHHFNICIYTTDE